MDMTDLAMWWFLRLRCDRCYAPKPYSSVPNGWNVNIDGTTYKVNNGQLVEQ